VSTANGATQNLTANRPRLLRALAQGDLSTDISDEAKEIEARVFALTGRKWNALNDPRCTCGLCVLETITRVADAIQSSSRRKLLFFIGSDVLLQAAGASEDARQDVGCDHRLNETREAMLAAVDRANLTVHSLDTLGLTSQNPGSRASSTLGGGAAARGHASATLSNLQRQGNLEVLPRRTGGRAVLNTNAPEAAVPALFRESESYYLLGFRPGNSSHDGKFHHITVTTARRGLDVRARSGFSMPVNTASVVSSSAAGAVTAPVREALTGLLPATAVPMALTAATFAGPDPRRAAVLLTLNIGIDVFGPSGASGTPIEIVASAFDPAGRAQGVARHSLTRPPHADQAGSSRQFDAQSRLDLPPGEYEIRVAVAGPGGPASVFTYVTVLPFGTVPLSLSSIVVVAGPEALVAGTDLIAPLLPVQPTARRTFRQGEPILALLRIHQGTGRIDPLASVDVRVAITDAAGKQVGASAERLDASQFRKDRSADHFMRLPPTLPPGDYLLTVETSLGPRTAGRAMRFTVEH
jgi:VWFA-related protein